MKGFTLLFLFTVAVLQATTIQSLSGSIYAIASSASNNWTGESVETTYTTSERIMINEGGGYVYLSGHAGGSFMLMGAAGHVRVNLMGAVLEDGGNACPNADWNGEQGSLCRVDLPEGEHNVLVTAYAWAWAYPRYSGDLIMGIAQAEWTVGVFNGNVHSDSVAQNQPIIANDQLLHTPEPASLVCATLGLCAMVLRRCPLCR